MPVIRRFGAVSLRIYADDHRPPHFHLVSATSEAMVAIADLRVIAGALRRGEAAEALEWARANRDLLAREWARLNERG